MYSSRYTMYVRVVVDPGDPDTRNAILDLLRADRAVVEAEELQSDEIIFNVEYDLQALDFISCNDPDLSRRVWAKERLDELDPDRTGIRR
jgi:hypothetical protein